MSDASPFLPSNLSQPTNLLDGWWANAASRMAGTPRDQWLRKINLSVYDAKGLSSPSSGLDLSMLKIDFDVKKRTSSSPDLMFARIYNLSIETMTAVQQYRRVSLSAGYQHGNYGVIFDGTVVMYVRGKESATDTYLDIFAGDGDVGLNNDVVNLTWPAGTTPEQKVRDAIGKLTNVQVGDIDMGKNQQKALRSTAYIGNAVGVIRDQMNATGSDFFVEGGKAHAISRTGYRQGEVAQLSTQTGMVGIPRITPSGLEVRCLLNPKLRLAGLIEVQTKFLSGVMFQPGSESPFAGIPAPQAATGPGQTFGSASISPVGRYKIVMLNHMGDSRGIPWYSEMICAAVGANNQIEPYPGDAFIRSVALLGGSPALGNLGGG
jgi:hypothetical protein